MPSFILSSKLLERYKEYLYQTEKAPNTIEKYLHDVGALLDYVGDTALTKEILLKYKANLTKRYKVSSVNSILSALNSFFRWCGWEHLLLKTLRVQRSAFRDKNRELSKEQYFRLLNVAQDKGDLRLWLLMQTLCATGIRISELRSITAEAAQTGRTEIVCKGKRRVIILPQRLCKLLLKYAKTRGIQTGSLFVTKSGKPLDRSNIWRNLKRLAKQAGISALKVFPHNLRHLFATTFYETEHDIAKLADVLGHSSINTTRIYIATSGFEHLRIMENLGLLWEDFSIQTTYY